MTAKAVIVAADVDADGLAAAAANAAVSAAAAAVAAAAVVTAAAAAAHAVAAVPPLAVTASTGMTQLGANLNLTGDLAQSLLSRLISASDSTKYAGCVCVCLTCFSLGAEGGNWPSGGGAVAAGGGRFSKSAMVPVPGAPGLPQEALGGSCC